jgi:hypothetical protein
MLRVGQERNDPRHGIARHALLDTALSAHGVAQSLGGGDAQRIARVPERADQRTEHRRRVFGCTIRTLPSASAASTRSSALPSASWAIHARLERPPDTQDRRCTS